MKTKKIIVSGLGRLTAFCHAVIASDFIYVSGTLGTKSDSIELVEGGTRAETAQALQNIGLILKECGASFSDLVKVSVFLADIKTFQEMNEAHLEVMGSDSPARITVGGADLARGAAVEIDAIAYKPHAMSDGITETQ